MKNKKLIYFLLPAVAIIWGIIGLRIYNSINEDSVSSESMTHTGKPHQLAANKKEDPVINLLVNYQDPFLNKPIGEKKRDFIPVSSIIQNSNLPEQTKIVKPTAAPIVIKPDWPIVEFLGVVENGKRGAKIGFVRIGPNEFILKEKDLINAVFVEKIFKDSIRVRFAKEVKTIGRALN